MAAAAAEERHRQQADQLTTELTAARSQRAQLEQRQQQLTAQLTEQQQLTAKLTADIGKQVSRQRRQPVLWITYLVIKYMVFKPRLAQT